MKTAFRKLIAFATVFLMVFGNGWTGLSTAFAASDIRDEIPAGSGYFGYKGGDNQTSVTFDASTQLTNAANEKKNYDAAHFTLEQVLIKAGNQRFYFDADGNLLQGSIPSAVYNVLKAKGVYSVSISGSTVTGSMNYASEAQKNALRDYLKDLGWNKNDRQDFITDYVSGISHISLFFSYQPPKGWIQIVKTEAGIGAGNPATLPVPGAKFNLSGPENKTGVATGDDGTVLVEVLTGSYTLRETGVSSGGTDRSWIYSTDFSRTFPATVAESNTRDNPVVVNVSNTRHTGVVTIDKHIRNVSSFPSDYTFTFRLVNAETGEAYAGSVTNDGSVDITVPYGTYTVDETSLPGDFTDGITFMKGGSAIGSGDTFTVNGNETLDCYNTPKALGSLTIQKTDGSTGAALAGAHFSVYQSDGDGGWDQVEDDAVTDASGAVQLSGLAPGLYRVYETQAPMGYNRVSSYLEATLDSVHAARTVAFQDTKKALGQIKIAKEITNNNPGSGSVHSFTVQLTGPTDNPNVPSSTLGPITIRDDAWTTVPGLEYGTYTVNEISVPANYAAGDIYVRYGDGLFDCYNETSTVVINGSTTDDDIYVKVQNRRLGSITISKAVDSSAVVGSDGFAAVFGFRLHKSGDPAGEDQFVNVASGGSQTVYLPYGSYTVTELPADGFAFSSFRVGSGSAVTTNSVTVDLPSGSPKKADFTVACSNTALTGAMQLTKNIVDASGAPTGSFARLGRDLTFTIAHTTGDTPDAADAYLINRTVTVTEAQLASLPYSALITGLPYGNYTIAETADSRFAPAWSPSAAFTIDGTATAAAPRQVACANTVNTGTLTVAKQTTGGDPGEQADFTFAVTPPDGVTLTPAQSAIAVHTVDGSGSAPAVTLPYGTYSIAESGSGDYDFGSFAGAALVGGQYQFTIGPGSTAVTVTATNAKKTGTLSVQKSYTDAADQDGHAFTFELSKKIGGSWTPYGTFARTVAVAAGALTLPYGEYRLKEVGQSNYVFDSFAVTSGTAVADPDDPAALDITVGDGSAAVAVTAVNQKLYGTLTISKTISGARPGDSFADPSFDFTVASDADGARYPVTVAAGDSNTLRLPYGAYTIEETANPAYPLTGISGDVTAETVGDATVYHLTVDRSALAVTADNAKQYGLLTIQKTVNGDDGGALPPLTFLVTGGTPARTVSVTVTSRTEGGAAVYDGSVWLPYGSYTVVEQKAVGYRFVSLSSGGAATAAIGDPLAVTLGASGATVQAVNEKLFGTIAIHKVDGANGNGLRDAVFAVTDSTGATVDTIITDEQGDARTKPLPVGSYTLTETTPPDGYERNSAAIPADITDGYVDGANVAISPTLAPIPNTLAVGGIELTKQDSVTHEKLAGAQFTIYRDEDLTQQVYQDTTGGSGVLAFHNVVPGDYWVVETQGPAGYRRDDARHKLTVVADETAALTVDNIKTYDMTLVKEDSASHAKLAGAGFRVYADRELTKLAGSGATLADGTLAVAGLIPGPYWVEETKAPDGYQAAPDPVAVEVKAGEANVFTIGNTLITGTLEILKEDSNTNEPLPGAVFRAYADEALTKLAGEAATGADGKLQIAGLVPGSYWVAETKAPDGYKLNPAAVELAVAGNKINTYTILNDPQGEEPVEQDTGSIKIIKVDGLTGVRLPGAGFDIFADEALTDRAASGVTDKNGEITAAQLQPGVYWIVETKAPKDYILNDAPVPVEVTAGAVKTITLVNEYNPPQGIQTGMMDYNYLLLGGAGLLGGALLVLFTRRRRTGRAAK